MVTTILTRCTRNTLPVVKLVKVVIIIVIFIFIRGAVALFPTTAAPSASFTTATPSSTTPSSIPIPSVLLLLLLHGHVYHGGRLALHHWAWPPNLLLSLSLSLSLRLRLHACVCACVWVCVCVHTSVQCVLVKTYMSSSLEQVAALTYCHEFSTAWWEPKQMTNVRCATNVRGAKQQFRAPVGLPGSW